MIFTELRNSTALGNQLTGLPHNEPAAGEVSFVYLYLLSIICCFLMAIYTWIHLLQCIVVVRSFLRMLKLCKLAVCKLCLLRGCHTRCKGVLDYGLNLHRNIPLI